LVFIKGINYTLLATQPIAKNSLLCEYIGEVKKIYKALNDEEFFILVAEEKYKGQQVLISENYANEARYISGIPEKNKESANC
jgi:hypothetical protein